MESREPHYLRFARTLALATTIALPACSDATAPVVSEDAGEGTEHADSGGRADSALALAEAGPTTPSPVAEVTDAGSDVQPARISGPLPPPELPAAFA